MERYEAENWEAKLSITEVGSKSLEAVLYVEDTYEFPAETLLGQLVVAVLRVENTGEVISGVFVCVGCGEEEESNSLKIRLLSHGKLRFQVVII